MRTDIGEKAWRSSVNAVSDTRRLVGMAGRSSVNVVSGTMRLVGKALKMASNQCWSGERRYHKIVLVEARWCFV